MKSYPGYLPGIRVIYNLSALFPRYFEYKFQPALLIHLMMLKEKGGSIVIEMASAGIAVAAVALILPYLLTVSV